MTSGHDVLARFREVGGAVVSLEWLDDEGRRIHPIAGRISAIAATARLQRRSGAGLISVVIDVELLPHIAPRLDLHLPAATLAELIPPTPAAPPASEEGVGSDPQDRPPSHQGASAHGQ